jgi:hypothetical protein
MADDNNPIYYKDLVSPDNSITDLIKQLDELSDVYANALKNIKAEAIQLAANLQKVSGATETGRKTTRAAATETDRLARAQKDLAFAESENAVKLAEIKQAQKEANEINKLTVKLNQSAEGSYNKLSAQYSLNKIYLNNMTLAERENTAAGKDLEQQTKKIYEEMDRLQRNTGKFSLNVGNYPGMTEALGTYGDKVKEVLGLNSAFGSSLVSMFNSAYEAKKKMLTEAPATLEITGGAQPTGGGGSTINTDEIEEATLVTDELGGAMETVEDGGEALKGTFANLGTNVKAFGQTLLGLMVNPVFLVIAGLAAAGAAFKFWFDYNKGLIEATNLTQQFTGLSGDAMKAYRNEVQALADMYDKDFKEVLQGANAVAKQFGISQQEALGYVRDGFLAGADANGEYLEGIKEYSAYFKEAGLSASEFIAISTQANKSGIYSDKAVDTIKEGNIRIREMTKATADALTGIGLNYKQLQTDLQNGSITTFDVMQRVSEKLNELPADSAVVGTAIADIFGGPGEDAGLQYLKTLKDIDTNLDSVKGQAGELGKIQEDQLRSQADLNNVIAGLFDATGGTFEGMTAKAKTFVNDGLTFIIKGFIDIINYGIRLYNDSVGFRLVVQSLVATFNVLWTTVKSVFTYIIETLGSIGDLLHAAFTLDFDEFSKAWNKWGENTIKLAKDVAKGYTKAITDANKDMGKKIKPITIPVFVATPGAPVAPTGGGGGKAKAANYDKPVKDNTKDLEAARKKNLELTRKAQDAQLNLETEGFNKREQQIKYQYSRQTEDLRFQLLTEKDLTAAGKQAINDTIKALEQQQTIDLTKLGQERNISELEQQKQGLQIRLDSARKGSEQEYQLKLDLLEKERQLELAANKQKPVGEQQSEGDINSKFDVKKTGTDDEFLKIQLARFDAIKDLEQSEFDLLRNSEDRKTRFRLNAEKERLQKILALNEQMGNKLTDVEVATIQNTIKKIDQEIGDNKKDEKGRDIYGLFGLNLDEDAKAGISESVNFAMEQMAGFLDAKVAMSEQAVTAADKEVDASQRRLDAELEARANGYANDVVMAQKELDNDRKAQDKANKEHAKAVKQQQMLDTISQTSSLITASANIWASLSKIPVIGTGLALAAIGVMWGSFAASKLMARQATKGETEKYGDGTLEFLGGGSHQSGNDVDLGMKANGTRRRAEGGEAFAVINKMGTRRFRHFIPDVINSLNNGTFANKYLKAYDGADGLSLKIAGGESPDMKQIKSDVSAIKDQGKRRFFTDAGGTVEIYKNLKRRIRN